LRDLVLHQMVVPDFFRQREGLLVHKCLGAGPDRSQRQTDSTEVVSSMNEYR